MPAAIVEKPGFLTTVQDLGRFGYRHLGVPVSGSIDPWALRAANLLTGNKPGSACLEMTLTGPTLRFLQDCLIAITGADIEPKINGRPAPMWECIFLKTGDILTFGHCRRGCRSYLAFAGGIDVPLVLGSRSTLLAAGFGGYGGRSLIAGDIIEIFNPGEECAGSGEKYPAHLRPAYPSEIRVRVIKGINSDCFSAEEYEKFYRESFKVTVRYNRMGCILEAGAAVIPKTPAVAESFPVTPGTVQVPPSGKPVVLLNDAQSTGGYPQIATVITADLWRVGQAVAGDLISFEETSLEEAHRLLEMKHLTVSMIDSSSMELRKIT